MRGVGAIFACTISSELIVSEFQELVSLVSARSPLQRKRIELALARQDQVYFVEAERFASRYGGFLRSRGQGLTQAVDAYLELCSTIRRCQVDFLRTGRYPTGSHEEAVERVYSNPQTMAPYMIGLALSQFLWPAHYDLFRFFAKSLHELGPLIASYLEVGPGHGLFLDRALEEIGHPVRVTVVDISSTSLELTRAVMARFRPEARDIRYIAGNVLQVSLEEQFDFVTMGEVLEHVPDPLVLLRWLRAILSNKGHAFVSTCANCPALDHLYQFNDLEQIRAQFQTSGLVIVRELAVAAEAMSVEEAISRRLTVNYCAILKRHEPI
jgi:ubiquinone/menaquinone biosynthesis C-methylase UbiE